MPYLRLVGVVLVGFLGALVVGALLHPYPRQSLFGPTVKGEPLWSWQQRYRQVHDTEIEQGLWSRLRQLVGLGDAGDVPFGNANTDAELLPLLLSLRADPSWAVRRQAATDLAGHKATPAVTAVLVALSDDPHADVRLEALESLALRGDPSALATIRARLDDPDPRCRALAALAVWNLGRSAEGLPALIAQLKGGSEEARNLTWWALEGMDRAVEPYHAELAAALAAEPEETFRQVGVSVVACCGPRAVPALLAHLQRGPGRGERLEIARSLGKLGDAGPDVMRALNALAADEDEFTRASAANSLWQLDPQNHPMPLHGVPEPVRR